MRGCKDCECGSYDPSSDMREENINETVDSIYSVFDVFTDIGATDEESEELKM